MRDFSGAIVALANYMGGAVSPALRRAVSGANKIQLFSFAVVEEDAADTYAVLRPFGGSGQRIPIGQVSLQVFVAGATDAAALAMAQSLHGTLLNSSSLTRRGLAVTGFVFAGFTNLRPPGHVGRRDEKTEYAFNFDAAFRPA